MKDAIIRIVSSMKFWTMILGFATAIGAKYGFDVDQNVYWSIVGLFGLLIGAQGLTDHGKEAAKITAGAATSSDAGTSTPAPATDATPATASKDNTK